MIRKSMNLINLFHSLYQCSVFISSVNSKYCLPPSKAIWIVAFTAAAAAQTFLLTAVSVFRPIITGMPARKTGKLMIRTMMGFSISNAPLHLLSRVKVKTEIKNLSVFAATLILRSGNPITSHWTGRPKWPQPGWRPAVLVKTRVLVGCSVSRAHKTWFWSLLFNDFPLNLCGGEREMTSVLIATKRVC